MFSPWRSMIDWVLMVSCRSLLPACICWRPIDGTNRCASKSALKGGSSLNLLECFHVLLAGVCAVAVMLMSITATTVCSTIHTLR